MTPVTAPPVFSLCADPVHDHNPSSQFRTGHVDAPDLVRRGRRRALLKVSQTPYEAIDSAADTPAEQTDEAQAGEQ